MAIYPHTYRTGMPLMEKAGGMTWLLLVFLIHLLDLFIRYRTGAVNFFTWTLFFVIYSIIALKFYRKWGDQKIIMICYVLTAFFIPFLYPRVMPYLDGGIAAMVLAFAPVWVIYLLLAHSEYYPKLSFAYMVFWIAFLAFSFMPQVQLYAQEQGYSATYSPSVTIQYALSGGMKAAQAGKEAITGVLGAIAKEKERTYKTITGDYYTGQVDESAQRPLGVFLEPLKSAQQTFAEDKPARIYSELKAETLAEPIKIKISCFADKIPADDISKQELIVEEKEKKAIDCTFYNLQAKNYNFIMNADFTFTTRAYQLIYTMDEEKLRETRRANKDPLADYQDKNPATKYSSGPVMMGMGGDIGQGKQPLGISATEKQGPTIGITIDNLWTGRLKKIEYILLITPKGIKITDINGIPAVHVPECALLPIETDRERCDDAVDNMYYVPQKEIDWANQEKEIIAYTFRAGTEITDYSRLVGPDPLPKNIKATVSYEYGYSKQKSITVEKSKTSTQPAETAST